MMVEQAIVLMKMFDCNLNQEVNLIYEDSDNTGGGCKQYIMKTKGLTVSIQTIKFNRRGKCP